MTNRKTFSLEFIHADCDARSLLLLSVCSLLGIGAIAVHSASSVLSASSEPEMLILFRKHLLFVIASIVIILAFSLFDYRWLMKPQVLKYLVVGSLVLLVMALLWPPVNGARRWIQVSGISFQPSELAKVVAILAMASFLANGQDKVKSFRHGFLPAALATGALCVLILVENDLGTPLLIGAVLVVVMLAGGIRLLHFLALIPVSLPFIYYLMTKVQFRMNRLEAYLDPWSDPQGKGYQIIQSMVAFHSGGVWGQGVGNSVQKHGFLPAHTSDFIFAIVGEELGFVGCALVFVLFALFLAGGLKVIQQTSELAGSLVATGILTSIGLQAVINMAVVTSLLPTKGIALPFLSLGGSSMLITAAGVGILMNIGAQRVPSPVPIPAESST